MRKSKKRFKKYHYTENERLERLLSRLFNEQKKEFDLLADEICKDLLEKIDELEELGEIKRIRN